MRGPKLGEMLLEAGQIAQAQLDAALTLQRQERLRVGQALVKLGFASERAVLEALARQLGSKLVDLTTTEVPSNLSAIFPARVLLLHQAVPIELINVGRRGTLVVAMADPANLIALDELAFISGKQILAVLASEHQIEAALSRMLAPKA
jgi:type IV pilus assembly protein PilB